MATTNEERKRYVKEYVRSLVAIEEAMEPYKEQKRDLRTEYRENGWGIQKGTLHLCLNAGRHISFDWLPFFIWFLF